MHDFKERVMYAVLFMKCFAKPLFFLSLTAYLWLLSACVYTLSMHSMDGEKLSGRYRFARENTGLIQVTASDGELLHGKFIRVGRSDFIESYEKTFGRGTIIAEGPDISSYGNAFAGMFGSSSVLADAAYGEVFNSAPGSTVAVRGPLFYWTASLSSSQGHALACYFLGSSYTGHGFGRCKSRTGKEYSVEF
jgi:hypothetical protein